MTIARVAVVGGGISGLAAAHRLRTLLGPGRRDRRAGAARPARRRAADRRPRRACPTTSAPRRSCGGGPRCATLLDELGLADEVVHPAGAAPSVRAGGVTVPLPPGTLLGVPTSAARLDGVLSPAGTAAARAERDRPLRWTPGGDVALGGLLRERFGDELADRLADPLLGGVYAGRVDALGLRATLPAVAAALDAGAPSLTAAADRATAALPASRAARRVRRGPRCGRRRPGVRRPARRLRDARRRARGRPSDVRLSTTVRALHRLADGWRLVLGPGQDALDVDAVVLAVPAPAVARLLADVAPAAARAAGEIELASSVVVALAYREADARRLPATSGVLVAAGEPAVDQGGDALVAQVAAPRGRGDRRPGPAADIAGPVRRGGDAAGRRRRAGRPFAGRPRRARRDHRRAGRGARAAVGRRPAAVRGRAPRPGRARSRTPSPRCRAWRWPGRRCTASGCRRASATARAAAERVAAGLTRARAGGRRSSTAETRGSGWRAWPASTTPR